MAIYQAGNLPAMSSFTHVTKHGCVWLDDIVPTGGADQILNAKISSRGTEGMLDTGAGD
jgi:hypothetical protein